MSQNSNSSQGCLVTNHKVENTKTLMKLIFTGISAVLITLSLVAIVTKTRTSSVRFQGIITVIGDDAVWAGRTGLLIAVLPLLVWLPVRFLGTGVALWWISLMTWLFIPFLVH